MIEKFKPVNDVPLSVETLTREVVAYHNAMEEHIKFMDAWKASGTRPDPVAVEKTFDRAIEMMVLMEEMVAFKGDVAKLVVLHGLGESGPLTALWPKIIGVFRGAKNAVVSMGALTESMFGMPPNKP